MRSVTVLAPLQELCPTVQSRSYFFVTSGHRRDTRDVKHIGRKANGDVLPPREVESDGTRGVPVGLGGEA